MAGQEGDRAAWLGLSKCDIIDKTRSGKHHLTRSFLQKVALRGFIAVCREDFNYHILRGVIISAAGSVKNPL